MLEGRVFQSLRIHLKRDVYNGSLKIFLDKFLSAVYNKPPNNTGGFMHKDIWFERIQEIQGYLNDGLTLHDIGEIYEVSRQRVYQVLTKYGLQTPLRERRNFLRDKEPKYYWLNKMMTVKGIPKSERMVLLDTLDIPEECPILGIKLIYGAEKPYVRSDNSPSIDQIIPGKGYTSDNIQIISWRANRIKNDSTPEELRKLADYMEWLTKNKLTL